MHNSLNFYNNLEIKKIEKYNIMFSRNRQVQNCNFTLKGNFVVSTKCREIYVRFRSLYTPQTKSHLRTLKVKTWAQ